MVGENGQDRTEKKLSPKQARAIRHLLEKPTIQAAAASTQIARSTMYEWLSDPDFKAALSAAESDKLTAVKARIVSTGSSSCALIVCVAPIERAKESLGGTMSTAMIIPAPERTAVWIMFRPTPPQPKTAIQSPARRDEV